MTVFRAYLKVLNKNKALVILYTVILIFFASFNMKTNHNSMQFETEKPNVLIVNQDEYLGITKGFIQYIEKNTTIIPIKDNEKAQNDALFYRDVSYIIYLPKNFRNDFMSGKNPKIEIKSTGDYGSSFVEMMLNRYFNVANIYRQIATNEETLVTMVEETLSKTVDVEMTTKLDSDHLTKAVGFYNFANYSLLAGCVFVICFLIMSFNDKKIKNRTMISSMNAKKYNRLLLLSNGLFALILWIFYVLLSFLLTGSSMFTLHGMLLIINSFIFTVSALTFAFLIGNIVHNKEALSGIVNVVALGSSFLCGTFVPMEWLPNFVLNIAHVFPSYYYIYNNELISKLEYLQFDTLFPIIINMGVLLVFALLFMAITGIITKRKNQN